MSVDTELPQTADAGVAAETAELLRTMAAIVRTVFGVALQAPADAEQPATEPAQLAPVAVAVPVDYPAAPVTEAPTLSVPVAVPESPAAIAVDFPAAVAVALPVQVPFEVAAEVPAEVPAEQPVALSVVPDLELPVVAAPALVIPAYSPPEPRPATPSAAPSAPVSLPLPDTFAGGIPVPAYSPSVPETPAVDRPSDRYSDRHSMSLLQEIAFLDD